MIATGNKDANALPNDTALLDRLLVIECHRTEKQNMKPFFDKYREHFIAEAFEALEAGERCDSVPDELQAEQASASENITFHDDPIENAINKVRLQLTDKQKEKGVDMNTIAVLIGMLNPDREGNTGVLSKADQYRVAKALTAGGWTRGHTNSTRVWLP